VSVCGARPKLPPDEVRRLRAWAEYGRSTKQVAAKLGVQPETVRRYLRRAHKRPL
jgi:DNA-binding CsgD family transcriptional regulator